MLHSNVVGGIAARVAGVCPIVWGIHAGRLTRKTHGAGPTATQRLEAALSHAVPSEVIACSDTSRREMRRLGYAARKVVVIPNGFDLRRLAASSKARAGVRQELGIADGAPVVGAVSRFHPQKDHRTLLRAAVSVAARHPDVHFLLCGPGMTASNARLMEWARPLGEKVHLLGVRTDIPRITAALDIAVSSSSAGEAFPLVIGEAMACEVPVVTTNCGDSKDMVGPTGRVVNIGDPSALADATSDLLRMGRDGRRSLGLRARQRVRDRYEISSIAARYADRWEALAARS